MDPILLASIVLSALFIWGNGIVWALHRRRGLTPAVAVGRSMEPAIPGGAIISFEYYPISINEGDIVTFKMAGKLVCHRVVEVDGDEVRMKGDNNLIDDGWFHRREIIGKLPQVSGQVLWIPVTPTAVRQTVNKLTDKYKGEADE